MGALLQSQNQAISVAAEAKGIYRELLQAQQELEEARSTSRAPLTNKVQLQEISELKKELALAQMRQGGQADTAAVQQLQAENNQLKAKLVKLEKSQTDFDESHSTISSLKAQLAESDSTINSLQAQLGERAATISSLKAQLAESAETITQMKNNPEDCKQRSTLNKLRQELQELKAASVMLSKAEAREQKLKAQIVALKKSSSSDHIPKNFQFGERFYQCTIPDTGVGYRFTPHFPDKNPDGCGPIYPEVIKAVAICQGPESVFVKCSSGEGWLPLFNGGTQMFKHLGRVQDVDLKEEGLTMAVGSNKLSGPSAGSESPVSPNQAWYTR